MKNNYEEIIETERYRAKKAENTIYKLRQEIDILKKSYNKNLAYISKMKKIHLVGKTLQKGLSAKAKKRISFIFSIKEKEALHVKFILIMIILIH